jgi:hypothetical protein
MWRLRLATGAFGNNGPRSRKYGCVVATRPGVVLTAPRSAALGKLGAAGDVTAALAGQPVAQLQAALLCNRLVLVQSTLLGRLHK